jgi:hypothetical protein
VINVGGKIRIQEPINFIVKGFSSCQLSRTFFNTFHSMRNHVRVGLFGYVSCYLIICHQNVVSYNADILTVLSNRWVMLFC